MINEIKHFGVLGMRWGHRSGNIPSSSGRTKERLNVFGTKRLSYEEREQKRRDVTKKLIGVALAAVGGYAIGSLTQRKADDKKFAASQRKTALKLKSILDEAKVRDSALNAKYRAFRIKFPYD